MPLFIFAMSIIYCSIGFSKTFIFLISFLGIASFILAYMECMKDSNGDPLYPKEDDEEDEEKGGD